DVPRRRLQPAGRGGARAELVEPPERPQKDGLSRVFRVGGVAQQAHRSGEHQVLEPPHGSLELVGGVHCRRKHNRTREVLRANIGGGRDLMTRMTRLTGLVGLLAMATACSGSSTSPSPRPAPAPVTVGIEPLVAPSGSDTKSFGMVVRNVSQSPVDL